MKQRFSRRRMLGGSIAAGVMWAMHGESDDATAPGIAATLPVGPHLFLDESLVERSQGLERVVTPPLKVPSPVITGPEDKCFQPYLTVLRNPRTGRYRIWYGVPENASQSHIATMESHDGIHWRRPHEVLQDPGPIQFGVSIIDDGGRDPDPARRYKLGWYHNDGLQVACSPDGLRWTRIAPGPVLRHDHDINSIHWDPIRGRYIAFVSSYTEGPTWKGRRRIPMQSVSDDLVHWRHPWRIVTPDDRDEGETQFYCVSGLIARGDLLIALVKVLRDDLKVDNAPPGGYGLGYTTLAWSRDGETWTRDTTPWLDRNPTIGTWDHAMAWGDGQIIVGGETFIYYGGYARGHKVERFTERQIGLARMPRDRYVALQAGDRRGTLHTRVIRPGGSRLTVNADVQGELRVGLLDASGRALSGYSAETCRPIRGAGIAMPVAWRRPTAAPRAAPLRLEFRLARGRVWGFEFAA